MEQPTDDGNDSILEEAYRLTHGERNVDYGHPLDDYTRTAALASALLAHKLKEPLTAEEAALFMCCAKMSRQINAPKRDNMVDLAGYAWVSWACTEERARRETYSLTPAESTAQYVGVIPESEPVGLDVATRPDQTVAAVFPAGRLQLDCGCYGGCKGHTTEAAPPGADYHAKLTPHNLSSYAAERAAWGESSYAAERAVAHVAPACGLVPTGATPPRESALVEGLHAILHGPKDPSGKPYAKHD